MIQGLENLINLDGLLLSINQIKEIKGLHNLTNLKVLTIHENQIPAELIEDLGGDYYHTEPQSVNFPQRFVEYCQLKKEKK